MNSPAGTGDPETQDDTSTVNAARVSALRRVLSGIFSLNLLIGGAKLGVGLVTGSLAMVADGVNSLMDAGSNVLELIGVSVASRPPDRNHLYGHRRFETLTSLAIVFFMLLALQEILRTAWSHWQSDARPTVDGWSFVVMVGALIIVIGMTLWSRRVGRQRQSSLLMAESHHLASDIGISGSVIAGLIVSRLGYPKADLIIALIVAAAIAWAAWEIIRDAVMALSDATPVPASKVELAARSVPGVEGVHNIRSRGAEGIVFIDLHIQVEAKLPVDRAHDIASDVARQVEAEVGQPADVTVHIEPNDPEHLKPRRGYPSHSL